MGMTINDAIERYNSNAEYERTHGNLQGCLEFRQLTDWLKDYKKLLEQELREPCEDCVSREELKKWLDMNFSFGGTERKLELFDRLDKELPSVKPKESKTDATDINVGSMMTREEREESVRILKTLVPKDNRGNGKIATNIAVTQAIMNAINALEQDSSEDCVSRKEVHEMLENVPINPNDKWFNWLQKACLRLADLPSVKQEQKTGRWIRVDKTKVKCSNCDVTHFIAQYPHGAIDYCPNCGARMESEA